MYQPPHFREDRRDVLHGLIRAHPLGTLVTLGSSGLCANPIPFVLDPNAGPDGTLRAHLSRANPQWRDFDPAVEALVIFQGPETYITPTWYETKRQTGKVVPTWNYAIVQARGALAIKDDPDWILEQVREMTLRHEEDRAQPWAVDDAPAPFVAAQLKGIVGIEIPIHGIEGKWKVSQNRPEADRTGVSAGLREQGDGDSVRMAALVDGLGGKT